jgi:hypothetical protein
MKKYYFLIIVALILGLVLTGCSLLSNIGQAPTTEQSGISYLTKGTEAVPDEFPLYAGQDWLVGEVLVWDDGTQLCVKYQLFDGTDDTEDVIGEGWGITETHLAVGKVLSDIPQTKKGNPIPGQFLYGEDELEGEGSREYCIPFAELGVEEPGDLNVGCGDSLVIAAHAVIEKEECVTISGEIKPPLTWSRSAEDSVVAVTGYGASWNPAVQLTMVTHLTAEDDIWDGGTTGQYFIGYSTRNDVQWASWPHANPGSTDLRRFKATFELDSNVAANITSAVLRMPDFAPDAIPINDNVYIFLNNVLQFWGGTRVDGAAGDLTIFQGMAGVPATATYLEPDWGGLDLTGWYIPGEFPDLNIAEFVAGANALDVFTEENDVGGGIAKLELVLGYEYQECITYSETAWAANDPIEEGDEEGTIQFEGANWATYFTYNIAGEPPTISSDDLAGPYPADEFGYFTVTTVNPLCGFAYEHVLFNYTIFGIAPSNIVSFKYYDEGTATWYDAPVIQDDSNVIGFFGPPTGFPMGVPYNESTTFEIKIDTMGTYPVTITLNDLDDGNAILATLTETEHVVVSPGTAPLAVGDIHGGGIVAYILQPGESNGVYNYDANVQHGLIAAIDDQSTEEGIIWAIEDYQNIEVEGTLLIIGSGSANTDKIIDQNGTGITYAAGLARAHDGDGYADWFLPSRDELKKLYINRGKIGGFAEYFYWSSSGSGAYYAWGRSFIDGWQGGYNKHLYIRVRAVRAF